MTTKPSANSTKPVNSMLKITFFGDPVLRQKAKDLNTAEIKSKEIQELISEMKEMVDSKKFGIGLAAPQIGKSLSLSVIAIKPTPTRPKLEKFDQIIINPTYTGVGRKYQMWEGCISSGSGNNTLYAKVPRYKKIKATWLDESAKKHIKELSGIVAHVFQHETDHLGGILFVDKVIDTSTYMLAKEYRKRVAKENARKVKK